MLQYCRFSHIRLPPLLQGLAAPRDCVPRRRWSLCGCNWRLPGRGSPCGPRIQLQRCQSCYEGSLSLHGYLAVRSELSGSSRCTSWERCGWQASAQKACVKSTYQKLPMAPHWHVRDRIYNGIYNHRPAVPLGASFWIWNVAAYGLWHRIQSITCRRLLHLCISVKSVIVHLSSIQPLQ